MISNANNVAVDDVPPALWRFGNAQFDELKWELRVDGAMMELEPRPLDILLYLLRHAGETVTREELLHAVWGHPHLSENALSNAIAKLRKALGDDGQKTIVTVHRVGYRLAPAVMRQEFPRAKPPPSTLVAGDGVPRRPSWRLLRPLAPAADSEVWLGQHVVSDERRVFKFSRDGRRLSSLKREATLSRLIESSLEGRTDIVRVLDWSFEEPPFFIECEYGGVSLPQWAEEQGGLANASLSTRLDLMIQMAEAVAAAHSVGVLHKDLKPANVLIDKNQSGGWTIRLTDFGSGGFADPGRLAQLDALRMGFTQGHATEEELVSGTPIYLAPELLQGHSPTVQSDIYALGVILYQLVVGELRRPMAPKWENEISDDLLRQDITDAASGDPVHRLSSAKDLAERLRNLAARHEHRRAEIAKENQQRAVQTALQRTRARRPWLIALGLSMSFGLMVSLWFFHLSVKARDEALRQFDIAQAVDDFLNNDLIAAANPNAGGTSHITVLEAVGKAAGRIDSRFSQSPQVAIVLHQTVGDAYRALGDYLLAESEFQRAKAIADAAFGIDSDMAVSNDLLLAQTLAYENRYESAQALLDKAETQAARHRFSDPMIDVRLWDVRAMLDRHKTNFFAAAEDSAHTLQALQRLKVRHPKIFEANSQSVFLAQLHAAQDYQDAGRWREAEEIERSLIHDVVAKRGMTDPLAIRVRRQLVDNLVQEGHLDEAGTLLPALIHDASRVLGNTSRFFLDTVRTEALVYAGLKRWQEALAASDQMENGYRQLLGLFNDTTARAIIDSARIAAEAGRSQQSISKYQEAYAIALRIQGTGSLLAQLVAYDLVNVYLDCWQTDQAKLLFGRLDPGELQNAAPGMSWKARLSYAQGLIQWQSGERVGARKSFESALRMAGDDSRLKAGIAEEVKKLAGVTNGATPNGPGFLQPS
jgi:non-specific serine/threonine protein kinase